MVMKDKLFQYNKNEMIMMNVIMIINDNELHSNHSIPDNVGARM